MASTVMLPEMGEGVIEGTLARWLVKVGDRIEQYAPIAEVETDKVTTETTSASAGVILKLCVSEGETIPVGTVLAYVGEPGEHISGNGDETAAAEPTNGTTPPAAPPAAGNRASTSESPGGYIGRISPVVGRMAAEHGIDLSQITGTGRDRRITKEDVQAYIAMREQAAEHPHPEAEPDPAGQPATAQPTPARAAPVIEKPEARPAPVPATEGAYDLLPLTGIRRSIAEHMVRSKHTSPHVTTVFEFDFSAVAAHRRANKDAFARDGVRLTFTAYIVAATIQALKTYPMVNSSWSDEGVLLKREINIGMATAIDDGLIVPVIKHADGLNLLGLARTINDLADRARNKQLKPDEVRGGTFSLTNHGTTGSLFATPIINQPQCGILGIGAIEKRVKVIDDAIAIRPLAFVSFTFDHRILDGAAADNFVVAIKEQIEGWR